jgi:hypothetical protein
MATVEDIPTDLALEIGEDLDPAKFIAAVREFFGLVSELSRPTPAGVFAGVEIGLAGEIEVPWRVKVRQGSNIIALDIPAAYRADNGFRYPYWKLREGTDALVSGRLGSDALTDKAIGHAKRLSELTRYRGGIVPMRIWVERRPFDYGPQVADYIREEERSSYHDFGTLEGTLNAITDKNGAIEIKVSDPLWSQAIPCKVSDEQLPGAMAAFRKRVELSGIINYNRLGRPTSIRVEKLLMMPDDSTLPAAADIWGLLA